MPCCCPLPSSPPNLGVSSGVEIIKDVPNPGQHQRAERVVDHRFIVDRQQALAGSLWPRVGSRVVPCRAAMASYFPRPRGLGRSAAAATKQLAVGSVHLRSKWTPIRSAHFASVALIYNDVETATTGFQFPTS